MGFPSCFLICIHSESREGPPPQRLTPNPVARSPVLRSPECQIQDDGARHPQGLRTPACGVGALRTISASPGLATQFLPSFQSHPGREAFGPAPALKRMGACLRSALLFGLYSQLKGSAVRDGSTDHDSPNVVKQPRLQGNDKLSLPGSREKEGEGKNSRPQRPPSFVEPH